MLMFGVSGVSIGKMDHVTTTVVSDPPNSGPKKRGSSIMHEYLLWLPLAAYSVHVLEEAILDWKTWAQEKLHIANVEWSIFDVTNMMVMFIAIAAAMVGWKIPAFGLIIPALMVINAIFFHILPTVFQRVISPGVITSIILFLPISSWIYYAAYEDGVLDWYTGIASFVLGGLLMASPIVFLFLRLKLKAK